MTEFTKFWFSQETLDILAKKWFESPSKIQEKSFPILMQTEKDMVWQSQTWSWKTAAFWLPLIEKILQEKRSKHIKAIILCPSRELAIQVGQELESFVWKRDLSVFTIYWWQSYIKEKRKIKSWIDILVGTPWRIIDHLDNKVLDFSNIDYFVLDEADEMLNMWFIDDIYQILETTPQEKRTILFSATMPNAIIKIVENFMKEYELIKIKSNTLTSDTVNQYYYTIQKKDKPELLYRLLDIQNEFYWIVFCRTKADVDELTKLLKQKWYNADCIHWDISQNQREKVISSFKKWFVKTLIATDVAARGLDVKWLTHVINFSIPENTEDYTHRIWRTWRAGKSWTAITFVESNEIWRIKSIQKKIKTNIEECQIPTPQDIINLQKENLKEKVWIAIDNHEFEDNKDLANELLKLDKPETVISALLNITFKEKFSTKRYSNISKPNTKTVQQNTNDEAKLFVAIWKNSWMDKKELIQYLSDISWVDQQDINDLRMLNDFSFINVIQEDAKKLIKSFYKKWKNWRPLISKAKENRKNK